MPYVALQEPYESLLYMLNLILNTMLQVWKEKAKGLKLDFEMKMLNMKNKEKDDQEAGKFIINKSVNRGPFMPDSQYNGTTFNFNYLLDNDSPQKQAPNGTAPVKTDSRAAPGHFE